MNLLLRRSALMARRAGGGGEGDLPAGYRRLAYVRRVRDSYIDTGFVPNPATTRIVMNARHVSGGSGNGYAIAGLYMSDNPMRICYRNGHFARQWGNGGWFETGVDVPTRKYSLEYYNGKTIFDGVVINDAGAQSNSPVVNVSLGLFASIYNGGIEWNGESTFDIFDCQIYDDGTLVRDFVACENDNGVVGFYDMVGKEFYADPYSRAFSAGPEIVNLPVGFQQLEYLQSSGTQYIDTGIVADNYKYYIEFGYITNYQDVFGSDDLDNGTRGLYMSLDGGSDSLRLFFDDAWRYLSSEARPDSGGMIRATIDFTTLTADARGYQSVQINSLQNPKAHSTIRLFGRARWYNNGDHSLCNTVRIYRFKVEGQCDLVPCIRKSDGEIGMYDKIRDIFLVNEGTGVFIAG